MNRIALAPVALLFVGCAGPTPPDEERLVGEWVVVDFRSPTAAEDRGQRRKRTVISEETWSEQFQGEAFEDFEYALDPARSPKHLDLIFTDADGRRLTVRAIYELLDGDRLRVCVGSPPLVLKDGKPARAESVRPTAFEPTAGPLVSYRRKTW